MINKYLIRKTLNFLFAIATACILLSRCQSDMEPIDCYEIEVIGPDRCGGGLLVSVKNSKALGETITYYDGNSYLNVIRVFTLVTVPEANTGFIRIRDFDPNTDENFSGICLALYAPFPVPIKVATFWSEEPC